MSVRNQVTVVPTSIFQLFERKSCRLRPSTLAGAVMSAPKRPAAFFASSTSPLTRRAKRGVSGIFLLKYITEAAGMAPTPSMTLQATSGGSHATLASATPTEANMPSPWFAKTSATSFPLSLTLEYSDIMVADMG
jgi:hypothetical protein